MVLHSQRKNSILFNWNLKLWSRLCARKGDILEHEGCGAGNYFLILSQATKRAAPWLPGCCCLPLPHGSPMLSQNDHRMILPSQQGAQRGSGDTCHLGLSWSRATSPAHTTHAWVLPVRAAPSACAQAHGEHRITPTLIQQNITLGKSLGSCKIFLCLFI